jgi:hypothetical protein
MGSVPDLSHIVYRPAGCGIKFLFVHDVGLVGVQDASGKRYFYGDTIEVTIDEVSDSITHPGSGILLQVWPTDKGCRCLFEVLMNNGERGMIQPNLIQKAA